MRIKFLLDYTGRETAMKEYKAGDEIDFPFAQASELIKLGAAEEVGPAIEEEPAKKPRKKVPHG